MQRAEESKIWREKILEKVNHNLSLIPEELVTRDYQTDSLQNKRHCFFGKRKNIDVTSKAVGVEVQKVFSEIFGFPYVVVVSQGRLAEAMACRLMVRNGHFIPGSALFPTTWIHQQLSGATPLEVMVTQAYDPLSTHPFKGNIDIELLEKSIQKYYPRWIPYICVEPCNNAVGGQPISMENMRQVNAVAKKYHIPVYLDACRVIENAVMIQQREDSYSKKSIGDILQEFCSYADGCTMSATKDFPVAIGGFFATRDENIYQRAYDVLIAMGSGLSYENKEQILTALSDLESVFEFVRKKMALVERFYKLLAAQPGLVKPVGANGVFFHAKALELNIPAAYYPEKSFLNFLYKEYGIRGAENPSSPHQTELGLHYLRFAVPLLGETESSIEATACDLLEGFKKKNEIEGLEKKYDPPGLTGAFRAHYKTVRFEKKGLLS